MLAERNINIILIDKDKNVYNSYLSVLEVCDTDASCGGFRVYAERSCL